MPPKDDNAGKKSTNADREITNLRKLLQVEKQNMDDLNRKYSDIIKSKDASFAKAKSDLIKKNEELTTNNTLLLKKFEDQSQVLKNANKDLVEARKLISLLQSKNSEEVSARVPSLEVEKLKLKNSVIGLSLQLYDNLTDVKCRVITDLSDIEIDKTLGLADQIGRYKLLKSQYESESSSAYKKSDAANSNVEKLVSFEDKFKTLIESNMSELPSQLNQDVAREVSAVLNDFKGLATKAIAKGKFTAPQQHDQSTSSVVELCIKQKVFATVKNGIITDVSTTFNLDDTQSSVSNTAVNVPVPSGSAPESLNVFEC